VTSPTTARLMAIPALILAAGRQVPSHEYARDILKLAKGLSNLPDPTPRCVLFGVLFIYINTWGGRSMDFFIFFLSSCCCSMRSSA
jgi:hypothetical protein